MTYRPMICHFKEGAMKSAVSYWVRCIPQSRTIGWFYDWNDAKWVCDFYNEHHNTMWNGNDDHVITDLGMNHYVTNDGKSPVKHDMPTGFLRRFPLKVRRWLWFWLT